MNMDCHMCYFYSWEQHFLNCELCVAFLMNLHVHCTLSYHSKYHFIKLVQIILGEDVFINLQY